MPSPTEMVRRAHETGAPSNACPRHGHQQRLLAQGVDQHERYQVAGWRRCFQTDTLSFETRRCHMNAVRFHGLTNKYFDVQSVR